MKKMIENLNYYKGEDDNKNWLIEEQVFDTRFLGKCESIFAQGNGYLGLRNTLEERYVEEHRNMFVTGTFNKVDSYEVPELPTFADITSMNIFIDGHRFSLVNGTVEAYSRTMNLKTGEVVRSFTWKKDNHVIDFTFRRFVSLDNDHVIGMKLTIKPRSAKVDLKIESGIDGRVTNIGVQHFGNVKSRVYDGVYLQTISETNGTKILGAVNTAHKFQLDGQSLDLKGSAYIRNRRNENWYGLTLSKGQTFTVEKLSVVMSSRDLEFEEVKEEDMFEIIRSASLALMKDVYLQGYDDLFSASQLSWKQLWEEQDIVIESENPYDQLSIRFAIYHLNIMVKKDDDRVGVGAKGLTGEEYKGHSFWDTEIFLMPYYSLCQPETARTLLRYRYEILKGARQKAKKAGYKGAMYPWESAWITDGEVTADVIGADIVTGEPMKVLTGQIEIHIAADIAYAVWQYYSLTGDEDFMNDYGYEMIIDTARFWASRAQWSTKNHRYEILNVIGPDEYKEEIDNDVYTNYLAAFNMELALTIVEEIKKNKEEVYLKINKKLPLEVIKGEVSEVFHKLYLPTAREDGLIPQNDTYLDLEEIDILPFKGKVNSIYTKYNLDQMKEMQVSKQGDLVVLFFLFSDLFDQEVIRKNYIYYESKTLHDSSLSRATHSIIANDLGMKEEAYRLYEKAARSDLGEDMKTSDNGIHSACCGGIWQCVVMGFGGVRLDHDFLKILPRLPKEWKSLKFTIKYQGNPLNVLVDHKKAVIVNQGKTTIEFISFNGKVEVPPHNQVEVLVEQRTAIKSTYKGVIFDLDGVLCSTDHYHYLGWKKLSDELGIYFDRKINERLRGVSRMESFEIILEKSDKAYSLEEKEILIARKNEYYKEYLKEMSPADVSSEVRDTLKELKAAGIKIAIGSSSKNAEFILKQIDLIDEFDDIVDGNHIQQSKPDPQVFLLAAERIGLRPDECLVVEDAMAGIEAARRGGFQSAGIGSSVAGCDYILKTFQDVKKIVNVNE